MFTALAQPQRVAQTWWRLLSQTISCVQSCSALNCFDRPAGYSQGSSCTGAVRSASSKGQLQLSWHGHQPAAAVGVSLCLSMQGIHNAEQRQQQRGPVQMLETCSLVLCQTPSTALSWSLGEPGPACAKTVLLRAALDWGYCRAGMQVQRVGFCSAARQGTWCWALSGRHPAQSGSCREQAPAASCRTSSIQSRCTADTETLAKQACNAAAMCGL